MNKDNESMFLIIGCDRWYRYVWWLCASFSSEHSTVFLTPAAFVNPDVYLEKEEIGVMSYIDYLSGKSSYNPGLKVRILKKQNLKLKIA